MNEENIVFVLLEDNRECGILTMGKDFKKSLDLFQESYNAKEYRYCQDLLKDLRILLVYCNANMNLDYLNGLIEVAKALGVLVVAISDTICELNSDLMISFADAVIPPMPKVEKYNFVCTKFLEMLYGPQMINLDVSEVAGLAVTSKNLTVFYNQLPINPGINPEEAEKRSITIEELMLPLEEKVSSEGNKIVGDCIFNVLGTEEMSLFDVNEIGNVMERISAEEANLIFAAGANCDTDEHYIGIMAIYTTFSKNDVE